MMAKYSNLVPLLFRLYSPLHCQHSDGSGFGHRSCNCSLTIPWSMLGVSADTMLRIGLTPGSNKQHTICCIFLRRCYFGLGTRVIIKIESHPFYPINFDWLSWGWSKFFFLKYKMADSKKLSFLNTPILKFRDFFQNLYRVEWMGLNFDDYPGF